MDVENWKRNIRIAEINSVRALRTAVTVLHDSFDDLDTVMSESEASPTEIQEARKASRKVFEPLLVEFAACIKLLTSDPILAEDRIAGLIKTCHQTIEDGLSRRRAEDSSELKWALERARNRVQ